MKMKVIAKPNLAHGLTNIHSLTASEFLSNQVASWEARTALETGPQ